MSVNIVDCIKNYRYGLAASHLLQKDLSAEYDRLGKDQRNKRVKQITDLLRRNHFRASSSYGDSLKPIEIAEKVYNQTLVDLGSVDEE